VIRGGKSGRRGARWHKVTFTFDFLALKRLIKRLIASRYKYLYLYMWRSTQKRSFGDFTGKLPEIMGILSVFYR